MKLAFIYRGVTLGGVENFLNHLLEEILQRPKIAAKVVIFTDQPSSVEHLGFRVVTLPKAPKLIQDLCILPLLLVREKVDHAFYTKNIIPFTHLFVPCTKSVIVYDLAFYYPKLQAYKFFDTMYMKVFFPLSLRLAQHVFTISEFSKQEIVTRFPAFKKKITILPLGVQTLKTLASFRAEVLETFGIHTPFIFYCGSLSPRKNVLALLQSFTKIQDQVPHQLVIVSGKSWNNAAEERFFASNTSGKILRLSAISTAELSALYTEASHFIFPSLYEGFGLPIIEAQNAGCPVGVLDTPVSREVAGKGAYYFSKMRSTELQDFLTLPEEERKKLITLGKNNVKKYTWSETARIFVRTLGIE